MYFPFLVHGTNIPWENGPIGAKFYGILVPWCRAVATGQVSQVET